MTARPQLLRADNFTPPTRTPWGGRRIPEVYKRDLVEDDGRVVGESWEVSVEPSFPSRLAESNATLAETIAGAPVEWLGAEEVHRHGGQTPLLVKLLDAADDLSVQVHPQDDDPALRPGQSGKPESWIVLEAEPGAGLYLGFREGVTRRDVEAFLDSRGPLDELLHFVPVTPGDAFVIAAGTPHAIGAGLTLVEPQWVAAGRRGITYRFWDWNRRYDADGRQDRGGRPRKLHVDRSLAVTDWDAPRGARFEASCRPAPQVLDGGPLVRTRVVEWPFFIVETWRGTGAWRVEPVSRMWALTCVGGALTVTWGGGELQVRRGQSVVVPAAAAASGELAIVGHDATIVAVRTP